MSSTSKGNELENAFYKYLLDQKERGELIDGVHSPKLTKIFQKKKYPCRDRGGDVEFDIVLEIWREGADKPYQWVVFECKNYTGSVPEDKVTILVSKLNSAFGRAVKGIFVVSSRLQSGAEQVAKTYNIGIIKFDANGVEHIAQRHGGFCLDNRVVKLQIFQNARSAKSLKFAAYHDGHYFDSMSKLLADVDPTSTLGPVQNHEVGASSAPFIPITQLQSIAEELLFRIDYEGGPVDLEKVCSILSIDLEFTKEVAIDANGKTVLGSANFSRNRIQINQHDDGNRERFTLGHEIGHFYLGHGRYLRSESVIVSDLLIQSESENGLNYRRLEFQANVFSSALILPELHFLVKVRKFWQEHDIRNRGSGAVYVDDQPQNLRDYHDLLGSVSTHFAVSKEVIEIRLKNLNMLADQRKRPETLAPFGFLKNFTKRQG